MARYKPTPAETAVYKHFLERHAHPYCWACGRGPEDVPPIWHAPWIISRAHVVSQPRVEAPFAIVLLCPLCHGVSHGERHRNPDYDGEYAPEPQGVMTANGGKAGRTADISDPCPMYLPKLEKANLLWLKLAFDPAHWSPPLLRRHSVRNLPEPEVLPEFYLNQHCQRRPENATMLEVMRNF